jgi:hypothetical protein
LSLSDNPTKRPTVSHNLMVVLAHLQGVGCHLLKGRSAPPSWTTP